MKFARERIEGMSMTTMTRRQAAAVEARAEMTTMRADRRFLWLWLTVATILSVAGNVGHAWLVATQGSLGGSPDPRFWMALGWAVAPPMLLMLAVHGLPTLSRMLSRDSSDRLLSLVVWGVTAGAFAWSAVGIYEFTVALGVPAQLAWVAPLTIDLSVFGATRGLVLTAPIAARMKAGMHPAPSVSSQVKLSAPRSAPPAVQGAVQDKVHPAPAPQKPAPRSAQSAPRIPAPASTSAVHPGIDPAVHDRAAALVSAGVTTKAPEVVAQILSGQVSGHSVTRIAADTGVHHKTVKSIIAAAEDADEQESETAEDSRPLAVA